MNPTTSEPAENCHSSVFTYRSQQTDATAWAALEPMLIETTTSPFVVR